MPGEFVRSYSAAAALFGQQVTSHIGWETRATGSRVAQDGIVKAQAKQARIPRNNVEPTTFIRSDRRAIRLITRPRPTNWHPLTFSRQVRTVKQAARHAGRGGCGEVLVRCPQKDLSTFLSPNGLDRPVGRGQTRSLRSYMADLMNGIEQAKA